MTPVRGDALVAELDRRFTTTRDTVTLAGEPVELMKPAATDALISEADFARDERLPYWADLWPSACVLADAVVAEAGRGRALLELGCGLGLVAIAALRAGYDVLATDYYADALRFTRANAWRTTRREPRTRHVDWRSLPPDLGTFTRVVAADVLYERTYGALVASVLASVLAHDGLATVADPGRAAAASFVRECETGGLTVTGNDVRRWTDGAITQRITLYTVRRAR